jgi:hypothetical protein
MKQKLMNAKKKRRYNNNAKGNGIDRNAPLLLLRPSATTPRQQGQR